MEKPKYSQNKVFKCVVCGNGFHPFRKTQSYCSKLCAAIGRGGITQRSTSQRYNCQCASCGKDLYRKPYLLRKSNIFFCDRFCQAKFYESAFGGEKNPNYKNADRDYSLGSKIRSQKRGKVWKRLVLERDNHKCVLCGNEENLHADHIYPLWRMIKDLGIENIEDANNIEALWDISNGRTLCKKCHESVRTEGELRKDNMPTNTERTLKYLKDQQYDCDVVERWIRNPKHPAGGFRKDWMGFADIIALGENSIIAVQSCGQAFSEHHKKLTEDETVAPNVLKWLECGGRLLLIGWRKVKLKRGGKALRWEPRLKEYTMRDLMEVINEAKTKV